MSVCVCLNLSFSGRALHIKCFKMALGPVYMHLCTLHERKLSPDVIVDCLHLLSAALVWYTFTNSRTHHIHKRISLRCFRPRSRNRTNEPISQCNKKRSPSSLPLPLRCARNDTAEHAPNSTQRTPRGTNNDVEQQASKPSEQSPLNRAARTPSRFGTSGRNAAE